METLVDLAKILALLSAAALCIYTIVVLIRVNGLLRVLQTEIIELNKSLKPVLENINVITERLRSIATKVDDQVTILHGLFSSFQRVADNVLHFEDRIQHIMEEPFMRVNSLLGNIVGKVTSFFTHRS
ncbi:MAG TPA: hypothetical protein VMU30_11465 [Bacteroidota bacterium]|nr:hypothetical protein [Bacteroidota bacterium]